MREGTRTAAVRERIREPGPGAAVRPSAPFSASLGRAALQVLAPFPHAVPTFVGRADELLRAHGLLARGPTLLVYGVPGIGKSEFVYRLIDELRESPAWRRARPVLLTAQRGQSVAELVMLLGLALAGPRRAPLHPGSGPRLLDGSDGDEPSAAALTGLAHALEQRPHLVFIDDAHHLDENRLLSLLAYLSRRVSTSRIVLASRVELSLVPDGPLPALIRLPPLGASETAVLASQLAERLGIEAPQDVFGATRGSPYHVQRALMRTRGLPVPGEDALLATLRSLSPAARRLFLLCRVLRGRLGELIGESLPAGEPPELRSLLDAQWELGRCFLVHAPRYTVHDLVWEAVAPAFSPEDHALVHRHAASLCLRRYAAAPEQRPLDALAALQHLLQCGDGAAAWAVFTTARRSLATPALEPLTLTASAELLRACPQHAEDLLGFGAQVLLRQLRIEDARAQLAVLAHDGRGQVGARALRLLGHLAARAGELTLAVEHLEAACRASAPDADAASHLELAWIAALRGEHALAARQLGAATAGASTPLLNARRARCRALCALLADAPQQAAQHVAEAVAALSALPAQRRSEEESELSLIDLALRCAIGDLPGARRALDQILFHGALAGGPPEPLQDLGRGALLFVEGALPAAQLQLVRAHGALQQRGDKLLALLAELLLAASRLRSGASLEAQALLEEARRRAARLGARPLELLTEALLAQALLASRDLISAGQAAAAVRAAQHEDPLPAWALFMTCSVEARLAALQADRAGAEQALREQERTAQTLGGAAQMHAELIRAEIALQLEAPAQALAAAAGVRTTVRRRGPRHELARAELAYATACASYGGADKLAACAESLEVAGELSAAGGYLPLLLGVALCEAALSQRRGDARHGHELLRRALAESPSAEAGLAAQPLRAALDPAVRVPTGVRALLTRLGLHQEPAVEVTDRRGARIEPAASAASERPSYDLIVDVERCTIGTQDDASRISGRQLPCLILARLLSARSALQREGRDSSDSVDAERLFYDVWGGREYNPLRHRNTIYVAITRLRQALRDVLPGREVIETTPSGWRLAPTIELCVRRVLT